MSGKVTQGLTVLFVCCICCITACGKPSEAEYVKTLVASVEAETGVMNGNPKVSEHVRGYSGEAYVDGFMKTGDSCNVTVEIAEDGFYDLAYVLASPGNNYRANYALVDGVQIGTVECELGEPTECYINRVYLAKGTHTVGLSSYWGYFRWDKLAVYTAPPLPKDIYDVSASLCNPGASDNARRLMSYLADNYGKSILSGQYSDGGYGSYECFYIKGENGGKLPAVVGLEVGYACQTSVTYNSTKASVKNAIDAWDKGGIVTMCYHWQAPEKYINGIWWNGFRSEAVNIPLDKIMNGEDEEGMQLLLNDIKILADELKPLQEADVPVLWRPLHEASGGWFWWGNYGADAYRKLYVLMYDQLVNVYGLNNLIWLWNGQDAEWYPGDEYVDIIGTDIYPTEKEYASHIDSFLELYSWLGDANKMIVLSENGTMPDVDACVRDGAMWGFFATWGGEFVINDGMKKSYSEQYTDKDTMAKIYNHEKVITLDELPDLKNYKIRKDALQK